MTLSMRWKINKPQVVHEVFEDEVVIVNLDNGNYYSLNQTGAEIWGWVENGASGEEIVAAVLQRYEGNQEDVQQAVSAVIEEFQREELVTPAGDLPVQPIEAPADSKGTKPAFEAPTLSRFTDMQDLLLLDPIHEVDETGWPHAKEAPSA
jgi:hypothetical protein